MPDELGHYLGRACGGENLRENLKDGASKTSGRVCGSCLFCCGNRRRAARPSATSSTIKRIRTDIFSATARGEHETRTSIARRLGQPKTPLRRQRGGGGCALLEAGWAMRDLRTTLARNKRGPLRPLPRYGKDSRHLVPRLQRRQRAFAPRRWHTEQRNLVPHSLVAQGSFGLEKGGEDFRWPGLRLWTVLSPASFSNPRSLGPLSLQRRSSRPKMPC